MYFRGQANLIKRGKASLLLLFSSLLMLFAYTPSVLAGVLTFAPSGLDGAGFENVVAVQPGNSDYVLAGSDVAGIQLSTDGGATWTLSNKGIEKIPALKVASIAFLDSSTVFAAVGGQAGSSGGLYKSTDAGVTWTLFSSATQFSGASNTSIAALPSTEHPRSTGNLLAFDSTGTYLYAGTFDDGVYRCVLSTSVCTNIGMTGKYIRSVAIDSQDDTLLYVAAYDDDATDPSYASKTGVFKGTSINGSASFSKITSPAMANDAYYVEELKFIGDNTMIAVGKDKNGDGKVYKVKDHGATWSTLLTVAGTKMDSVDGYWDASLPTPAFVIIVGSEGVNSIYYSQDNGVTWSNATANKGTGSMVGGGTWWMSQDKTGSMMNASTYVAAHIAISSTVDHTAYVAGRSGVWKSTDKGASWNPAVRHMNVTFNRDIKVDPNTGNVYTADTDWQFLWSVNQMGDVRENDINIPSGASGRALAINPTAGVVYLGVGNRNSNINGGVYSSTDPTNTVTGWTSENLDSTHVTGYNGERVLALAAKDVTGNKYVMAAVEGKGIYRKINGSNWTLVNSNVLSSPSTLNAPMVWDPSRPYAYLYDRDTGVWRGSSNGGTWGTSPVYAAATSTVNSNDTGYLALDSANDTLYISNDAGLFYQTNASTAAFNPVKISVPSGVETLRLWAASFMCADWRPTQERRPFRRRPTFTRIRRQRASFRSATPSIRPTPAFPMRLMSTV